MGILRVLIKIVRFRWWMQGLRKQIILYSVVYAPCSHFFLFSNGALYLMDHHSTFNGARLRNKKKYRIAI